MGILDTAKEAVQLVQKIDNIELYKQILDLQSEALKLVEEHGVLKGRIKDLEDKFVIKEQLLHKENAYWISIDDGTSRDIREGPFCVHCWDKDQKLVRLHHGTRYWWCLTHPIQFEITYSLEDQ